MPIGGQLAGISYKDVGSAINATASFLSASPDAIKARLEDARNKWRTAIYSKSGTFNAMAGLLTTSSAYRYVANIYRNSPSAGNPAERYLAKKPIVVYYFKELELTPVDVAKNACIISGSDSKFGFLVRWQEYIAVGKSGKAKNKPGRNSAEKTETKEKLEILLHFSGSMCEASGRSVLYKPREISRMKKQPLLRIS